MRPGLRAQLLLALTLVTLTVMATAGWVALFVAERGMDETRDDLLARSAAMLATGTVGPGQRLADVAPRLQAVADEFRRAAGVQELIFLDGTRRVVTAVGGPGPARAASVDEPAAALALRSGTRVESGAAESRALYEPIRAGGRVIGVVCVHPGTEPVHAAALGRARRLLLGLSIIDAVVLLGAGALILGRYVVGPIEALSRAARRVAAGDLEHRVAEAGAGEITNLARSFNQMGAALASQREQIVRSEKLASLGRLAAGVAHEVGNPLASVLGYAEMLSSGRSSEGEVADHARRIKAETERIHRILTELLEYARPRPERLEAVSLRDELETARSLLAPQTRAKHVEVLAEIAADTPPVTASPGRLTQVFVNLILNAADAMNEGGHVTVSTRTDGDHVTLRVADDGPGVPAADLGRLFEPFFSTKAPGKGVGLGLAVCQSIVESFGGTIAVDSAVTRGAAFVIRLRVWRGGA